MRLHKFFCSNVRCFLSRFILDVTAYTSKRSVTHVLHIKIYPFFLLDLQKSDRFLVVPCHVGIQFSLDAHPFIFLHFLWPWWKRIAFLEFFFSLSKSCKKSFFMWVFHARSLLRSLWLLLYILFPESKARTAQQFYDFSQFWSKFLKTKFEGFFYLFGYVILHTTVKK